MPDLRKVAELLAALERELGVDGLVADIRRAAAAPAPAPALSEVDRQAQDLWIRFRQKEAQAKAGVRRRPRKKGMP
jgi:hypothetical protein